MNLDSSVSFFIKNPRNYILVADELTIRSVPKDARIHTHTSKIALDNLKQIDSLQADKALEAYRASLEPVRNFCNLYGLFYHKLNFNQKWSCHAWCESATTDQEFIKRTKSFEKAYNLYARGYLVEYFVNIRDLNLLKVAEIISSLPDEANFERICLLLDPVVLSFVRHLYEDKDRAQVMAAIDKIPLFCRASIVNAMKPFAPRILSYTIGEVFPLIIAYNLNDRAIITAVCEANPSYNEPTKKQMAFHLAAQYGFLQTVSGLIQEGHINQNLQEDAFVNAATYGHLDIVNFLLPTMPQPIREDAVLAAAARGHLSIVQVCFQLGIRQEARDRCFNRACQIGEFLDVIRFLLTTEISEQTIIDVAYSCESRGQYNIIEEICASKSAI